MEIDFQYMLELIDRPVFIVRDGIIQKANQMAKNRLIRIGEPIDPLITQHADAYRSFQSGQLYLTLDFGELTCGASVSKYEQSDVFIMDREQDLAKLQTLALAGQQMRTPLSNVMILADTLLPRMQEDSKEKELVGQLSRGLFQLLRIVGNMTDAERYVDRTIINMQLTELSGFLKEVFAKAQTHLSEKSIRLHYEGPPKAIFTLADTEQLERAIYNMISNAAKFAEKNSTVTATAEVVGKMVRISVENLGETIPQHIQGSLFHRYQREPSIEDNRHGLGLGFTLIHAVASVHGGTVLVDRSGGTRVTMTLAIRKQIPGGLRSPVMRISDYSGGWDSALVELSDTLPVSSYENIF